MASVSPRARSFPPRRPEGRLGPPGRPRPAEARPRLARRRITPARSATCWSFGPHRFRAHPSGALELEESQAAAAVGQIALARSVVPRFWPIMASRPVGCLLTLSDTEDRRVPQCPRHALNAAGLRGVPVINENDTVATAEIRFGDNDRLAARVATMIGADLLVLFSDVDGLYTAPPGSDPSARHSGRRARHAGHRSDGRRSGLRIVPRRHGTKIEAGKDRGRRRHPHGDRRRARQKPAQAHRRWRPLYLVPDALEPCSSPRDLDCRRTRDPRHPSRGRGRGPGVRSGASLLAVVVRRVEGTSSAAMG